MTILFDSTRRVKTTRFGLGLDRPTDTFGNPLPRVGYSTADAEWYASQLAEHAEPWASWPDWTDERWTLSDAEADRLAEEAEANCRVEFPGYL
ncbi:hypothetical protein AB1L88_17805 [Tautonia sp. JC769]|uniref:hypothetical protein n=1 Tax=Tautonia sp. JC769 TaxID=3232135 RepID=UPI00345B146B